MTTLSLSQIREGVCSDHQETRVRAMQSLLMRARKEPELRPEALQIFRTSLPTEWDPYSAMNAALGIHAFGTEEESCRVWEGLLKHPRPEMVAAVVLAVRDASYVPLLLEILEQRQELTIQSHVLRVLGRLRDVAALPALLRRLEISELRGDAIKALEDLGDSRAIAALENLRTDKTPLEREDNHGPMLRICDFADQAIERLRPRPVSRPQEAPPSFKVGRGDAPSVALASGTSPLFLVARKANLFAYGPLAASFAGVAWVFVVIILALSAPGHTHAFDVLGMVPGVIGLGLGVVSLVRPQPLLTREKVCLFLGSLGCSAYLWAFGSELLH